WATRGAEPDVPRTGPNVTVAPGLSRRSSACRSPAPRRPVPGGDGGPPVPSRPARCDIPGIPAGHDPERLAELGSHVVQPDPVLGRVPGGQLTRRDQVPEALPARLLTQVVG